MRQLALSTARAVIPTRMRPRLFQLVEDTRIFRAVHREASLIEAELGMTNGHMWSQPHPHLSTARMTERVVEIPWVLTRVGECSRLLDIGTAFAPRVYVRGLLGLGVPSVCGLDLSSVRVPGVGMAKADVRHMPFTTGRFDVVTCISTIEHIGLDNAHYAAGSGKDVGQDARALAEMERVLKPGGRILITVPFGEYGIHSWFKQYDLKAWRTLVASTNLREEETGLFELRADGWTACPSEQPPAGQYRGGGAPGATGVLCACLIKPHGAGRGR